MTIESNESNKISELRQNASNKSRTLGPFSLTAEDHKAIGSTPPDELVENPEKALYETMSDKEIENILDYMLDCTQDPVLVANGFAQISAEDFYSSLNFLRSVGRLPHEYADYQ